MLKKLHVMSSENPTWGGKKIVLKNLICLFKLLMYEKSVFICNFSDAIFNAVANQKQLCVESASSVCS